MKTEITLKLESIRAALLRESGGTYAADPVAFNTALAKHMAKLKKDLGVAKVQQNYKGTGKQAHRRQIWVSFEDMNSLDVWLDSGFAKLGGVINAPIGIETVVKYGDDPIELVYGKLLILLRSVRDYRAKKNAAPVGERSENEWRDVIKAALKKGYEKGGFEGLKLAAYELEGKGASTMMLVSILKDISRTQELDGMKLISPTKFGFVSLGMYADDLRRGR